MDISVLVGQRVEIVESIESRDISTTKRPPHFCNVISYTIPRFFFRAARHVSKKLLFRFLCNLELRPFLRNFKTKQEQTTVIF